MENEKKIDVETTWDYWFWSDTSGKWSDTSGSSWVMKNVQVMDHMTNNFLTSHLMENKIS